MLKELHSEFRKIGVDALTLERQPETWEEGFDDFTREMTMTPKTFSMALAFRFLNDGNHVIRKVTCVHAELNTCLKEGEDFYANLLDLFKPKIEDLRQEIKASAA